MHILILNWRDIMHPLAGGAEISLLEHAKYWQKKGASIVWIASGYPGAKKSEVVAGIKILRYGSAYTVHIFAFIDNLKGHFKDFDIIIDAFHFIPYFSLFYRGRKKKIIGLINEVAGKLWFLNLFFPFACLGYWIEPYVIKLYQKAPFITGSDSAKKELLSCGIKNKNIHVIHHGFTSTPIVKSLKKEKDPVLLFVGRISKDKGIDDVFEVFKELKKEKKNARLWIVGKEEQKGTIAQMKKNFPFSVTKSIHYYGYISEKEKFSLLKRSWILIHASQKEGWGLNVIEANSVGTPAVGYDIPGLVDSIKNKQTGLLAKEKTPQGLLEQIRMLLNDPILYKSLSINATIWSNNFSWNTAGEKSWDVIQKCMR